MISIIAQNKKCSVTLLDYINSKIARRKQRNPYTASKTNYKFIFCDPSVSLANKLGSFLLNFAQSTGEKQ